MPCAIVILRHQEGDRPKTIAVVEEKKNVTQGTTPERQLNESADNYIVEYKADFPQYKDAVYYKDIVELIGEHSRLRF
jgi:uncharacterized protein YpmS